MGERDGGGREAGGTWGRGMREGGRLVDTELLFLVDRSGMDIGLNEGSMLTSMSIC